MNSIILRSSIDNTSPSAKQNAAEEAAAARKIADPSKLDIKVDFSARRNRPKPQRTTSGQQPPSTEHTKLINTQKLLDAVN